jgi:hypothetical protein
METNETVAETVPPLRLVSTEVAAGFLGLSTAYMEKLRVTGGGCVYRKIGSRVLYDLADLEAWAASFLRSNTAEYRRSKQAGSG